MVPLVAMVWLAGCVRAPDLPPVPDPVTGDMPRALVEQLTGARHAVLATPTSSEAWGRLGAACDAHRLYEAAAICYRTAHRLAPDEFTWVYLLAVVEDFRGTNADEVAALFERAISLNGEYPPAYVRFGQALVRQGDLAGAGEAYEAAIGLDEDFALAHRGLGQVLLATGRVEEALQHLLRAAEITPEDGVIHATLAQLYQTLGRHAEADAAQERARRSMPRRGVPDPLRYRVEQLGRSGNSTDTP